MPAAVGGDGGSVAQAFVSLTAVGGSGARSPDLMAFASSVLLVSDRLVALGGMGEGAGTDLAVGGLSIEEVFADTPLRSPGVVPGFG